MPITAGLQGCIKVFEKMDETIERQPILDRLEKKRSSDSLQRRNRRDAPGIGGGLSVALARAFKIIDPGLKHPHSEHWDCANRIFSLLL